MRPAETNGKKPSERKNFDFNIEEKWKKTEKEETKIKLSKNKERRANLEKNYWWTLNYE